MSQERTFGSLSHKNKFNKKRKLHINVTQIDDGSVFGFECVTSKSDLDIVDACSDTDGDCYDKEI